MAVSRSCCDSSGRSRSIRSITSPILPLTKPTIRSSLVVPIGHPFTVKSGELRGMGLIDNIIGPLRI